MKQEEKGYNDYQARIYTASAKLASEIEVMREMEQIPSGYNVYQARLYTTFDVLTLKNTFTSEAEAKQSIFSFFHDEHYGPSIHRGVIRKIDPLLKQWVIPFAVNNKTPNLFDPNITPYDGCKVSLYSMNDAIMQSLTKQTDIPIKAIKSLMAACNAFYAVKSFHAVDAATQDYLIWNTVLNHSYNFSLLSKTMQEDGEQALNADLFERYADLIKADQEETERMINEHPEGLLLIPED